MHNKIAFIGAGNMAASIIKGLVANDFPASAITASAPSATHREPLQQATGIQTTDNNQQAVAHADIVLLAVKPHMMQAVSLSLAGTVQTSKPLIVSIAAGITLTQMEQWLGTDCAIVRCMPNTPAQVQSGITAAFANQHVTQQQRQQVTQLLSAIGAVVWVDQESQLDDVTAISGSGPAYFFAVMEAMQTVGEEWGLAPEMVKKLVLQTALGAAQLAVKSDVDVATLREQVTSPGGTTEAALMCLQHGDLPALFKQAMTAARDRANVLAQTNTQSAT